MWPFTSLLGQLWAGKKPQQELPHGALAAFLLLPHGLPCFVFSPCFAESQPSEDYTFGAGEEEEEEEENAGSGPFLTASACADVVGLVRAFLLSCSALG